MTYESYDVYVDSDVDDEFRQFCAKLGNKVELNWRDTHEE